MRLKFLGVVAALAVGGGIANGQPAPSVPPGAIPPGAIPPGGDPSSAYPGSYPPGAGPPIDGRISPIIPPQGYEPYLPGQGYPAFPPSEDGYPIGRGLGFLYGGVRAGNPVTVWTNFEYLMFFSKGQRVGIPLLTTSAVSDFGVLGALTTTPLIGGETVGFSYQPGWRFTAGVFVDPDRRLGIEATGFFVNRNSQTRAGASSDEGGPLLAVPYQDQFDGGVNASRTLSSSARTPAFVGTFDFQGLRNGVLTQRTIVNIPGVGPSALNRQRPNPIYVQTGPILGAALFETATLSWGTELNGLVNIFRGTGENPWNFNLMSGVRYFLLDERMAFFTSSVSRSPGYTEQTLISVPRLPDVLEDRFVPTSTSFLGQNYIGAHTIQTLDTWHTTNDLVLAQVGFSWDARLGPLVFMGYAKAGAGLNYQVSDLGGQSAIEFSDQGGLTAGARNTAVGGSYNVGADLGIHRNITFAIAGEIGLNLGIQITPNVMAYAGGSALWVNGVTRVGDLHTGSVNSALVPVSPNYGAATSTTFPRDYFPKSDFWLFGANFGLQLRY
ncbi:MAG: BBP7 family outer membrane beta-barrel protein [Gemmataceae bacterium]|nr:BBP7 family outer membrane beta-barrel protein [Gemmataceae bacterium]